jgi:hypothetical protein
MRLIALAALILGRLVLANDLCDIHPRPGINVVPMSRPPALPVILHNVLPGEGWVLGSWTVADAIPIYNSWESEPHVVSKLQARSTVVAL